MSAIDFPHDELAEPALKFTVHGIAAPAGSKRHVGGHRIIDASSRSAPWKTLVSQYAADAMADTYGVEPFMLFDGPLAVRMTFYVPRPKTHWRQVNPQTPLSLAGVLRESAPRWPTTRPDVLKLGRAVEDACTGIVWRDDAQIVQEWLEKKYGEPARVEVVVIKA